MHNGTEAGKSFDEAALKRRRTLLIVAGSIIVVILLAVAFVPLALGAVSYTHLTLPTKA